MSENKILERLKKLYQLAILQEHELENEARQNEARTSAFLLLKIARENGVKVKFEVPPTKSSAPYPNVRPPQNVEDIFETFFRDVAAAQAHGVRPEDFATSRGRTRSPFTSPPRGRTPPSQGWPSTARPGSPFEHPRRSGFSVHPDGVIVEVTVNGERQCSVCGTPIFPGEQAWMIAGFGFSHMNVKNIHDPCTCDEGLAAAFKEKRKQYKYKCNADDPVIFERDHEAEGMSAEEMGQKMRDILNGATEERPRRRKSGL